jgi:HEAT repeat protein
MPYAPAEAAWRTPYLKFLAGLLTAPAQYPLLRERAAAALVTTGAPGAITIFRAALKSSQAQIQRLACLGLGALGHAETVADLRPLLESDDADVQLAAGLGLGAIGTEEALEALIIALTQGEEKLRQAAAESFAAIPDQGYPVLYDAIADEDILLRRAAVFGLRRIKTPWALIAIYRTFLEDQQWYVRSAAQMAFHELQYGRDNGPRRYPQPHSLTWLAEWATARGQNIKPGAGAVEMLIAALQQGEPPIRQLAAAVIGQLGLASSISMLYETLCDPIPDVRENAHRALGNLQMQIGQGLPLPA